MKNYSLLVFNMEGLRDQLSQIRSDAKSNYVIQLCSTQRSEQNVNYSQQLRKHFINTVVIGQSTTNTIHNGTIIEDGTLVIISEFKSADITGAVVPLSHGLIADSIALRQKLSLNEHSKAIISYADGIDAGDTDLYRCFDTPVPPVPVSGGVTVENEHGRWVLLDDSVYQDAVVAVAIHSSELQVWYGSFNEWNPIGRKLQVTSASNNTVYSLDNKPVSEIYNLYLADGNPVPFSECKDFPLMKGEKTAQNIYSPQRANRDGSYEFSRPLTVGEEVRFSYNHPSLTIEQVQLEAFKLSKVEPEAIFVYNCSSRLDFMDGNDELLPFEILTSTNGTYCGGEICRDAVQQKIMHHSMTYLAMREGERDPDQEQAYPNKRTGMSPLFSLIRNAFADADTLHENLEQRLIDRTKELTESYRIDYKTELPNRMALNERLAAMTLNEHLITMKLTNFPHINEKYGYKIGDQLLSDITHFCVNRLNIALGKETQLYSIGIGEWATVIQSDSKASMLRQRLTNFAEQIEHVNFEPTGLPEEDHLSIAVCAGVVSRRDYPEITPDDILLKSIESRRYAKKHNRHVCSAKQLEASSDSRQSQLQWLSCVSRAVLSNNVVPYAQPILDAKTHEEVSLECLVRIRDEGKIIAPGQFLPIIEGTHLYTRLSRQMIKQTFSLMKEKESAFSINLSPQDLMNDKTIQLVEKCLLTTRKPSRVGLEVLETEQIRDYGRMIEVCNHLRALGARIIVDDFGSGYSNIDEILKLEPQIVKIDGSLIKTIDTDSRQRKVAQTLVQLCKVFGAKTVAEFVHNEEVCRVAQDMGVDYLQGYHLGQPYMLQ